MAQFVIEILHILISDNRTRPYILLLLRSVMTNQTHNPWYSTKLVVFLRSSGVPQSLVFKAVGSGQKCCRLDMLGQVCRICSGICSLSPHSQRAVGWRPIFLRCWWSLQYPVRSQNIVTWHFSLAGGC
jgi:hypothetical protein